MLISVARVGEMLIAHFDVIVVALVSEWANQHSRIHGGGADEPTLRILYQPRRVWGIRGFHHLAGGQPDVWRGKTRINCFANTIVKNIALCCILLLNHDPVMNCVFQV